MDRYSLGKWILRFHDDAVEAAYADSVLDHTLIYSRIAWGLVVFLGGSFAVLDPAFFGERAGTVFLFRVILLLFALVVIAATFIPRMRPYLVLSPALFILSVGSFCILLTALSDPSTMTPYFTGLFFAFAGIFSIPGLGFAYSVAALLANLVLFDVAILYLAPVAPDLQVLYNFFLQGIILVYIYAGYLVERTSRENFAVSDRLRDSLSRVKQLSGLLPICAQCKKVRDDEGYWNRIETYIGSHSEAEFSHSICPDCAAKLYPETRVTGSE